MEMFAEKNRGKLYLCAALLGMILFLGGVLLGFGIAGSNRAAPEPAATAAVPATPAAFALPTPTPEAVAAGAIGAPSVLEDTVVVWQDAFQSCGHVCPAQGETVTGCTEAEMRARFPGRVIVSELPARLTITAPHALYCPAHLVLKLEGAQSVIMQTDPETLLPVTLIRLDWDTSALPQAERAALEAGVPFDELAQIDEYIENLES